MGRDLLPDDVELEIRTRLTAAFPQPNTVEIEWLPFEGPHRVGIVVFFTQAEKDYVWAHRSTLKEWTTPESLAYILAKAEVVGTRAKLREVALDA